MFSFYNFTDYYISVQWNRSSYFFHLDSWNGICRERVPQSKELFTRFSKWGKMTVVESKHVNQPVFALDNCCTDTQWLEDGGFTNPEVVGDAYHITKRILSTASAENRTSLGLFACELRKCFGSTLPGIFWPARKIISSIEAVKLKFEAPGIGVWTQNTTKAFKTEVKHIENCLALPKVIMSHLYTESK